MSELPQISHSTSRPAGGPARGLRYLALGVAANALFWGIAFLMMKETPRVFTSQWSVIFLGGATKANVNIPDIGTASARAESPFNKDQDVKASYKIIATTDAVLKSAAAKLGMTSGQFGTPRVTVVEGTALMNFEINGSTSEEAQKKAYALHEAFQERLNQLRLRQAAEQEAGFENSLSVARRKLETSQLRLSDYKVRSGLASQGQVNELAKNIEELRRLKAEITAQQREAKTRADRLSNDLRVNSQQASDAFALRVDPLFQQYIREYSESTTNLTAVASKFGPNHPIVVREAARQAAAQAGMQNRAQTVLRRPLDERTMAQLNVGAGTQGGTAREELYKNIVTVNLDQQGLDARAREIDRQMALFEERLKLLSQRSSTLEALNRDMQIAEAVFSSTLAGLDASKADIFGAYPPIQMVAEPNLPGGATVPQKQTMVLGALIASILVSTGLFMFWFRKSAVAKQLLRRRSAPSTI